MINILDTFQNFIFERRKIESLKKELLRGTFEIGKRTRDNGKLRILRIHQKD